MQSSKLLALSTFLIGLLSPFANAKLITQQVDFSFSAGPVSGTGSLGVVSSGDFTATVAQFDPLSGTLNSFKIDWSVIFGASGTAGDTSGSSSSGAGGTYSLGGTPYTGTGSGSGSGGPAGANISYNFTVANVRTWLASEAGLSYDPALLAAVLGSSNTSLLWDASYSPSYSNLNNFTGSANGRVILTYDFTPAVPVPATLALMGLGLAGLGWSRRKKA